MAEGVAFDSEDDFDRAAAAIRYVERLRRSDTGTPPPDTSRSPATVDVKVTGAAVSGWYPGNLMYKNLETDTWWVDEEVRVQGLNGEALDTTGTKRYQGIVVGAWDGYARVIVVVGSDSHVWAKVTGRTTISGEVVYSGQRVHDKTHVLYPADPVNVYTDNIYRSPSNLTPPDIDNNQVVRLEPSEDDPTKWVVAAVGSLQEVSFQFPIAWQINSGSPCTVTVMTTRTVTIRARDIVITVV